jgi:hypothetical protein
VSTQASGTSAQVILRQNGGRREAQNHSLNFRENRSNVMGAVQTHL